MIMPRRFAAKVAATQENSQTEKFSHNGHNGSQRNVRDSEEKNLRAPWKARPRAARCVTGVLGV